MKKCPNCQKEFPDSMRFCQTDGTPLVEAAAAEKPAAPPPPPPDPYKTVVGGGGIKMDDDLLQIPEKPDPMKTMVSPLSTPKADEPSSKSSFSEGTASESTPPPPPPKSSEPGLSPPSFGDLSSSRESAGARSEEPPTMLGGSSAPPLPPPPASPFGDSAGSGRSDSPFGKPSSDLGASGGSPFDKPQSAPSPFEKTPPPPYKEPETRLGGGQPQPQPSSPFNQSPFGQPQSPFGQQNDPFGQPQPPMMQQNEWTPPPAPVAEWQDQGLGQNTPFQPPVAGGGGGQNNTLAIVSLVCGILGICVCGFFTGIPAIITGYMAKNNADSNPAEYGGRGMAVAGMILGGVSIVLSIIGIIIQIMLRM